NIVQAYGWAVGSAAVAVASALAGMPWLGPSPIAVLFLFPVMVGAWHGGAKPAALATLLGVIATVVLVVARPALAPSLPATLATLILYVGVSLAIAWLGERAQQMQRRARIAQGEWQTRLERVAAAQGRATERATRLAHAIRAAHLAEWHWDIASGRVERDEETGSIFDGYGGLPRQYTIEDAWRWVHPEDRTGAQALVQAAVTAGSPFSTTLRLQSSNGAVRWVEVRGTVTRNEAGQPMHVSGVIIDIDERQRAEEALRAGEERFRSLADHAPVLLWGVDANGSLFLNRECLRFTGVPGPVGAPTEWWRSAAHPDDADDYIAHYTHAVEHRALFEAQVRLKRADGEFRSFKSVGVPRYGRDGAFLGYAGCSFDITEMKQYIAELARTERSLLDAGRRKDEFLSSLSHELRNPLSPIQHAASLLAGSKPKHQFQKAREVIDRQVAELTRVLDELMDVSRIAQRTLELRRQRLDLRDVLGKVLQESRPLFESKNHLLDVAVPEHPLPVDADASRLAQVFAKLFENAAKYTEPGGSISVRAWQDDGWVQVAVRDNGAGIAPEELSRIFDMFSQADAAARGTRHGLGIGLGLARGVVTMHGGQLDARSEGAGKGSEFHLKLPLAASVEPGDAAEPQTVLARPKGFRILVADDVRDAAEALAMALRTGDNEVRVATDGEDALAAASEFRPDVAVLDIGMPKLTGYEVARRLRNTPWGERMTLIALTAWGQQDDVRRALEVGFNYHMVKPVNVPQLQELLEQLGETPAGQRRSSGGDGQQYDCEHA
ncbi:MAG TPA: ATP-binding protein, partial [Burkholderiales bacterium]|nr:ATP-binding protein [Burkholderiales bacterium]